MLAGLGALTLLGGVVGAKPGKSNGSKNAGAVGGGGGTTTTTAIAQNTLKQRLTKVYQFRQQTAHDDIMPPQPPAQVNNGDHELGSWAVYGKGLLHDTPSGSGSGIMWFPDRDAQTTMIEQTTGGEEYAFSLGGVRGQVNPASATSYGLEGADWFDVTIPPAPSMTGDETAAELVELYWQSLLRDVPFAVYDDESLADGDVKDLLETAAAELDSLSGYRGPTGLVGDRSRLFRGTLPGSTVGPHVSQFLLQPVPRTRGLLQDQKYRLAPEIDYMQSVSDWLAVQQGDLPTIPSLQGRPRGYIHDGRGLSTAVHFDAIYELPHAAALVLLGENLSGPLHENLRAALNPGEEGFVDFGVGDVLEMVASVSRPALHAAWVQKWHVHRRPRPEYVGGVVNALKQGVVSTADYPLHEDVLNSVALLVARNESPHDTYLLSQAFPEGSPTHPAYPAGHSTFAAACVTVLKAYFDEDATFGSGHLPAPVYSPDGSTLEPYTAEPLTVGGELNKLTDNIAIGRNWAGIHYRTDATGGYELGENIAIASLLDRARSYSDDYPDFPGFTFTKFDGETVVTITADGVTTEPKN